MLLMSSTKAGSNSNNYPSEASLTRCACCKKCRMMMATTMVGTSAVRQQHNRVRHNIGNQTLLTTSTLLLLVTALIANIPLACGQVSATSRQ